MALLRVVDRDGIEHEIDGNPKVEFEAAATDFALIHGYWLTPYWQIFETLGYANTVTRVS